MWKFVGHKLNLTVFVAVIIGSGLAWAALVYGSSMAFVCSPEPCEVVIGEGTPNENTNIQIAHINPTIGDAGVKIQAAIDALMSDHPEGGIVDATGFVHPSNLTGFTIPAGVTVHLNHGLYTLVCGVPITINEGGRLIGEGTSSPGATKIKLGNNCNHDIVHAIAKVGETGWWHHAEIAWIRFDCNKANNTIGTGIRIWQPGEVTQIHNVLIQQCPEDALWIKGSWAGTQSIDNVTMNLNDGWAIHLFEFRSTAQFNNVGGDDNGGLLWIEGPRTGGGNVQINNFKYEGPGDPVFLISDGSAPVQLEIVNGGVVTANVSTPIGDIVKLENAFCLTGKCVQHKVMIRHIGGGQNHKNVLHDVDRGVEVVSPIGPNEIGEQNQRIPFIYYDGGSYTILDQGKFVESTF
jgi:hypothetical protein